MMVRVVAWVSCLLSVLGTVSGGKREVGTRVGRRLVRLDKSEVSLSSHQHHHHHKVPL